MSILYAMTRNKREQKNHTLEHSLKILTQSKKSALFWFIMIENEAGLSEFS